MNKGIKYLIVGVMAAGVALSSYAANIEVIAGANANTYLTDSSGNYTPSGWLLELGTFASTPTDGSSSLAGFTVFGTGLTGVNGGDFTVDVNASETGFSHKQIYLVAFNAATQGAATQEGIYYVNDANNTGWRFPAGTDTPTVTTIELQELVATPDGNTTTLATGAHTVFGSSNADGTYNQIRMAAIPEPSSLMLLGVGLLGMVGLLRRRS